MKLKKGEIGLVNLKLRTKKGKTVELEETIFSLPYDRERSVLYFSNTEDKRIIKRTGLKEDLVIVECILIKSLGFKQISKDYTFAKANKLSKRDKLGGYE